MYAIHFGHINTIQILLEKQIKTDAIAHGKFKSDKIIIMQNRAFKE